MPTIKRKHPRSRQRVRIVARPFTATDGTRASLTSFPLELVSSVSDLLAVTSPRTLLSLRRVSTLFHQLATTSLCRHVVLSLASQELAHSLARCRQIVAEDLCAAVRSLTIVDDNPASRQHHSQDRQTCIREVSALLPQLNGLVSIEYRGASVPDDILRTLSALSPQVKLHTNVFATARSQSRAATAGSNLVALRGNTVLHTLDVSVMYFEPALARETMASLKHLLLSCPHVRSLSLHIDQPAVASAGWGPSRDYCGLGLAEDERLPPLEQLAVSAYPFGREGPEGQGVFFNTQGYPAKGKEIDMWADNFDWSQCKRLSTFHGDLAMKLMPKLTALTEFQLEDSAFHGNVTSFCSCVPALLTRISAPTLNSLTLDGILQHAPTLRELRFHRSLSENSNSRDGQLWDRDAPDLESLRQIQEQCRLISDLALDVPSLGHDLPYPVFDCLASFPRLRRLEIWLRGPTEDQEISAEPVVSADVTKRIFSHIRTQTPPGRSPPLQRLVLHAVSLPSRRGVQGWESLTTHQAYSTYTCQLAACDDEAALGTVEVNAGPPSTRALQLFGSEPNDPRSIKQERKQEKSIIERLISKFVS